MSADHFAWSSQDAVLAAIEDAARTGRELDFRLDIDRAPNGMEICVTRHQRASVDGARLAELLRNQSSSLVKVDIWGLHIVGECDLSGLNTRAMLSFRECFFGSHFIARDASLGPVSLAGSTVGGICDLRGTAIEGFLFLRFGFYCLGGALLRETLVRTTLNCEGAGFFHDFYGDLDAYWAVQTRGECFSFERGSAKTLIWRKMQCRPGGAINLRNTTVDEMRDGLSSPVDVERDWPEGKHVQMERFEYQSRSRNDVAAVLAWLALQDETETRNPVSAYNIAAKAYAQVGDTTLASAIGAQRERLLLARETKPLSKLIRFAYVVVSDGGNSVSRIVASILIGYLLSIGLIWLSYSAGYIVPADRAVVSHRCFSAEILASCPGWREEAGFNIPVNYPAFDLLGYTFDHYVPAIAYGFSEAWVWTQPLTGWLIATVQTLGLALFVVLGITVTGVIINRPR